MESIWCAIEYEQILVHIDSLNLQLSVKMETMYLPLRPLLPPEGVRTRP